MLLTITGWAALNVFNTLTWDEEDNYEAVIAKFQAYSTPRKNETYERYVFHNRLQGDDESIEQYVTDLKSQSMQFLEHCVTQ